MKGIIAEIHGKTMIVITKSGDFITCKKLPNCDVGDEVNIPVKNIKSIYKKISTIAASFIIFAMLSSGVYAYYTPYSYISIDINPSLELYVNRFDKVIGVHAFNEDAKKVIATSINIKNKNVDVALKKILGSAAEAGYLKENDQNSVMIVVSSNNQKEEDKLSDKVGKASTAVLSDISSNYDVILEKTKVESYKKAKEQNVSPGKVILADKFKEVKPEIDKEQIKHMPLQQAIKEIEKKDNKGHADNKGNKDSKDIKDNKAAGTNPTIASEKPKSNVVKSNVMNVRELIKEKNEELGKKLEKDKDKNEGKGAGDDRSNKDSKSKDRDRANDKKDDDRESFNPKDKVNNKEKNKESQGKSGEDNKPSKDKKDDKENKEDRGSKGKNKH